MASQNPVQDPRSPRYFKEPALVPHTEAVRFLWGDDESRHLADLVYGRGHRISSVTFTLSPGGYFRASRWNSVIDRSPRVARGSRGNRHRAVRLADPPADWHERGSLRERAPPGDRTSGDSRGSRTGAAAPRGGYRWQVGQVRPLPGARELLGYLSAIGVPWGIATSGRIESAGPALELLGSPPGAPVVTRDQVAHAKPDPDLFVEAAAQLGVEVSESVVVGDSVWDLLAARRARALGVGVLSGGYGQEELERAGAYRVYQDPADLLRHLDEVGVRVGA
jgi:phosphoglycolate phosphatase-like HAD superfamily hydrolase